MWTDSVWQGRNLINYFDTALKKMPLLVLCNKSDGQTQPTENPVHAEADAPAPAPAPPTRRPSPTTRARRTRRRRRRRGASRHAAVVPDPDCGPGQGRLTTDALQAQNRLDVRVIETTVTTGKGIDAGFQWLTDKVDYM